MIHNDMFVLIQRALQYIFRLFQKMLLYWKVLLHINRFSVSNYQLFFLVIIYNLSTNMVPISFLYTDFNFSIFLVKIKGNDLYFILKQFQKINSSIRRANNFLVLALNSFLDILADINQLTTKFSILDVFSFNLIQLNKMLASIL